MSFDAAKVRLFRYAAILFVRKIEKVPLILTNVKYVVCGHIYIKV